MATYWEHSVFVFRGRVFFCWLELVELFRLYLGASLCNFTFLALSTFALCCWDIHDRGSIFVLYVSCFKLLIDLYLWVLHWYMFLLCVFWNQDFILFYLYFPHMQLCFLFKCFRKYTGWFNWAAVFSYNWWIVVKIEFVFMSIVL